MEKRRPDSGTQKRVIGGLLKKPLIAGEAWYIIDTSWFNKWKKLVRFHSWHELQVEVVDPGQMDNQQLLYENGTELKHGLIEDIDYVLVQSQAWTYLLQWYGLKKGQVPLRRTVIKQGMYTQQNKVEVYMLELKLVQYHAQDEVQIVKSFSRSSKVADLEIEMRKIFAVPQHKNVKIWAKLGSQMFQHLHIPDSTLQECGLHRGHVICIELQGDDGFWPKTNKIYPISQKNSSETTHLRCNDLVVSLWKQTEEGSSGGDRVGLSLCDVTLNLEGGRQQKAHWCVLISCPYFHTLYDRVGSLRVIELKKVAPEIAKLALKFIYLGHIEVNEYHFQDLLKVADLFQLETLKAACAKHLADITLCRENCVSLCKFGKSLRLEYLHEKSRSMMISNFKEISSGDEILSISNGSLKYLLKDERLRNHPDITTDDLFLFLVRWVKVSDQRIQHFPALFSQLDVNEITSLSLIVKSSAALRICFEEMGLHVAKGM